MSPAGMSALESMVARQEGLRLKLYRDTQGKATIGFGHNLDAKGISRNIAQAILSEDIEDAMRDMATNLPWYIDLNEQRQGAMVSLSFNLGIIGLMQFKSMLEALRSSDWQKAHDECLVSLAAHQDKNRYQEIANIFLTGVL